MRIAVVGTRDFKKLNYVNQLLMQFNWGVTIVSGGARGVDEMAIYCADDNGLQSCVFPADWNKHGKAAGLIRNQEIVDNSDMVFAFWDGKSRGTLDTITKARKAGKPVFICEYA